MKCPTRVQWVLALLVVAPMASHSQEVESVAPANGPAGEIRCTLLCATAAAAEGSVCEVGGALDASQP